MDKLRTLPAAIIKELQQQDPGTALTLWALRQLVANGEIPVIRSGRKPLVSIESIEKYVNSQLER